MSHLPCCRYALNNNFVELVTFLDTIQTINQREIAEKASEIIIKSYFKDLKPKVQNLSSFKYPDKLASSGFLVHSFCTHEEYANKLLTPNVLPASMAVRTPLLFPLNLVSRRDLVLAFAEELKQCFSLPKLTTHTRTLQVSSVEVVILSQYTLASLTATSKRRCLQDGECTVWLAAVQVNLTYLSITASAARLKTKFTPQTARIITRILRTHTFRGVKTFLALLTEAIVMLAKQERKISQSISTNAFRRQHNLSHYCPLHTIKTIIEHSLTPIPPTTTPFTIPVMRICT